MFLLEFSLRSSPSHLWVIWVYIMRVQKVCIKQYKLAEQNVSRVSCGKALPARYSRDTTVSIYIDFSHSSHVQGTCIFSRDAQSQDIRENFPCFNSLSLHTLSYYHTTLTIKSHNKYRVHKIENNYNQIWHGIKANKIQICKSQLYNLPLWLFRDKTPNNKLQT